MNYYNEFSPEVAAWIRQLANAGEIPPGRVDRRDVKLVRGFEVEKYTQCHWFAGVAGWSLALKLAGWPEDRPIWTASLPCQGFSCAGKQLGVKDERHLWPVFYELVKECRPLVLIGEQSASKLGREWVAGVHADLEALDYRVGVVDLCAAGAGASHIRQRLYWVADSTKAGRGRSRGAGEEGRRDENEPGRLLSTSGLADADGGITGDRGVQRGGQHRQQSQDGGTGVAQGDTKRDGLQGAVHEIAGQGTAGVRLRPADSGGPVVPDGYYVIRCTDGKSRRVERGVFPILARLPRGVVRGGDPGAPLDPQATAEARAMRIRGYGNALHIPTAVAFIKAYLECE